MTTYTARLIDTGAQTAEKPWGMYAARAGREWLDGAFGSQAEAEAEAGRRQAAAAKPPTRTITLTDRPPVRIREDEWPMIAQGSGDSYAGNDYGKHQQALARGEVDEYTLRARQHADGRVIVYAVLVGASAWTGSEDRREGELLGVPRPGANDAAGWDAYRQAGGERHVSGATVAATIREVGERCGLPDSVIRECIADLPAEEV
jgi:hypothetical protein